MVLAIVLTVAIAAPAAAHAELESTEPAQSAVLLTSPRQVVLHFGEPVDVDFGSVRVLAPDGHRVDEGGAHHPRADGRAVAVAVPARLAAGTYVVVWRVISDDSHPVQGGFVFSVGTAAGAPSRARAVATALAQSAGSGSVGVVYGIVRFVLLASVLVLVGMGMALVALGPADGVLRRARRLMWASWTAALLASLFGIAVQGVYAAALPLGRLFSWSLVDDVVHTRFGAVQLLRCLVLVVAAPVVATLGRPHPMRRARLVVPAAALGLGLLLTPGLAGHAANTGNGLVGETLDAAHLAAAAVWLGGLVLLGTLVVPGRQAGAARQDLGGLARAFAPWALGAVAVVVATGVVQSLRNVGSWYALVNTPYGRLLLAKIGLVALLVLLGATTRRVATGGWLRAMVPAPVARTGATLALTAELVVMAGVLGVTATLVDAVPARQAAAAPFVQNFDVLGVDVNAVVLPARAGVGNLFHFYVLGPTGRPTAVAQLDASITLRSAGIAPIGLPLVVASPGHYQASGVKIPQAGTWDLVVTLHNADRGAAVVVIHVPVH